MLQKLILYYVTEPRYNENSQLNLFKNIISIY